MRLHLSEAIGLANPEFQRESPGESMLMDLLMLIMMLVIGGTNEFTDD
jgi:CelD/BcsL family acetyltransferase involved in cellulose biosynthesis